VSPSGSQTFCRSFYFRPSNASLQFALLLPPGCHANHKCGSVAVVTVLMEDCGVRAPPAKQTNKQTKTRRHRNTIPPPTHRVCACACVCARVCVRACACFILLETNRKYGSSLVTKHLRKQLMSQLLIRLL